MKMLFFHRWVGVHLGGTETHVRELCENLRSRGHQISILTRQGGGLSDLDSTIKVYRVRKSLFESDHSYNNPFFLYFYTGLFMIKSFLFLLYLSAVKGQRFDVISVHFITEAWVARIYRLFFRTPYVFVLEGYTALEAEVARKADAVVAISQHEVEETEKNHGYRPLYIPKGRNESFNLTVSGGMVRQRFLADFEKLILAVGRIEPRKDYPTLVETARLLKNQGKKYRFLIAGDGIDFTQIKNLISEKKMESEVVLLGPVANKDLPFFYRAADLFFLPTLYEGFGYVFIEAMACGLPVVSTKVGAVPEVVDGAGLLVEPRSPELLAKATVEILEDRQTYGTLSAAALRISQNYDWSRLVLKYEAVYQEVIKKYA